MCEIFYQVCAIINEHVGTMEGDKNVFYVFLLFGRIDILQKSNFWPPNEQIYNLQANILMISTVSTIIAAFTTGYYCFLILLQLVLVVLFISPPNCVVC